MFHGNQKSSANTTKSSPICHTGSNKQQKDGSLPASTAALHPFLSTPGATSSPIRTSTSPTTNTTSQIAFLQNRILDLTSIIAKQRAELDTKQAVHDRDMGFVRNLLYTLNHSQGFVSVTDQHGSVIDLTAYQGDHLYEIRINEEFQKQQQHCKTRVKKVWGNEFYFKALLGSQERTMQAMMKQLEYFLEKEAILGDSVSEEGQNGNNKNESANSSSGESLMASMENEILQIISLIEAACQRHPELYYALREQHQLFTKAEKKLSNKPKSLRTILSCSGSESSGGMLEKMLDRCRMSSSNQRLQSDDVEDQEKNCNSSHISPKGGRMTPPATQPLPRRLSKSQQGSRPNNQDSQQEKKNPNLTPNGASTNRATTSPPPHPHPPTCFDISDFEKFIGTGVLHVRGTNIPSQEISSVLSRNGSKATTKKKNRIISKNAANNAKIAKKSENSDQDQGDNPFLTSTAIQPIPNNVTANNRPSRGQSPSVVGQSSANTAAAGTATQQLLTTGGTSVSSPILSSSPYLDNAQQNKNRSSLPNNSSFPAIVLPVKRPHSEDNLNSMTSRSQSLPPPPPTENASIKANINATNPLLITSSKMKTGGGGAKTLSSSPGPAGERKGKFGGGGEKLSRSETPPRRMSSSSPSSGSGNNVNKIEGLPERKQKGGGGKSSNGDLDVAPPVRRLTNNNMTQRPKTAGHAISSAAYCNSVGVGNSVSVPEFCRAGMSCPYCSQDFDKNMSPDDVRKHLEKHVFQRS